jgi:hypothetical protein
MCIPDRLFLFLCDLYPHTGANLKYRALERRRNFMKLMRDGQGFDAFAIDIANIKNIRGSRELISEERNKQIMDRELALFSERSMTNPNPPPIDFSQIVFQADEVEGNVLV